MEIILVDEHAAIPVKGTVGSAGYDLKANIQETIIIQPGKVELIPSGIKLNIGRDNIVAKIYPRSGKGHKEGKVLGNLVGIIDSDYQGEIMISMWNRTDHPIAISPNEYIAQMVFEYVHHPEFKVVEVFSDYTVRGIGGFGSTDD